MSNAGDNWDFYFFLFFWLGNFNYGERVGGLNLR